MSYTTKTREELIAALEEKEILLQALLEEKESEASLDFATSGNLGHWYLNFRTNNVVFNPLKVQALGYSMDELPEEVKYSFFTDLLHPEDYVPTMDAMLRHMHKQADIYEIEYRILAKDGSYRWFYDRGKITQWNADGTPLFAAGIVFDITEKKEQQEKLLEVNQVLRNESNTDSLTGIKNRRAILAELEHRMEQSSAYHTPLSILLLDLDHFKKLNDTYGHVAGDEALKAVSAVMARTIRGLDSVGRYGGEEFLVVLPNTSYEHGRSVGERIREGVERLTFAQGMQVTISGGVALYNGENWKDLIRKADEKVFEAKGQGRNRIR